MKWNELIAVTAVYYQAGEYPWPPMEDDAAWLAERKDWDADDWWGENALWWFPGVYGGLALPALDADHRLTTDAVCFVRFEVAGRTNVHEYYSDNSSMLAYELELSSARNVFSDNATELKALCDQIRGERLQRKVDALIVVACAQGRDCDDEYWSDWGIVGALDLERVTMQYEVKQ